MAKQMRVDRPVVDIRRGPNFKSELLSQALYSQGVTVLKAHSGYVRVKCADGYVGWARIDHLSARKREVPGHMVDVPSAALLDGSTGKFVGRLSFGTYINIVEKREAFGRISFLDRDAWISKGCVRTIPKKRLGWKAISTYLENLIGTPYVWGGRSGFGLDCSGLVQLVFNSCGFSLKRDSVDQRKSGRTVSLRNIRPGDLTFSPGHVAVYFGKGKILHASARAGGVYLENLFPELPDSRSDIYDKIELVKRVI